MKDLQRLALAIVVLASLISGCGGGPSAPHYRVNGSGATQNVTVAQTASPSPLPASSPSPGASPQTSPSVSPTPANSPSPPPPQSSPTPATASALRFTSIPLSANALSKLPPIVVTLVDANGNLVPNTRVAAKIGPSVTLSASGGGQLFGTLTVNAVDGVATFDNVGVRRTGNLTFGASSAGLPATTSSPVSITPLPVDLATRRDYPVTATPLNIVAADFNGDNIPDFVNAPRSANTASVYLGQADGSFAAGTPLTGLSALLNFTVAAGDFDGDNKTDLLFTLGAQRELDFFKGRGDGTFLAPVTVNGDSPSTILPVDLDHNGKLDFLDNDLRIAANSYLNGGSANFTQAQSFVDSALAINPTSMCVADFDGDGKLDWAYADVGQVSIALGRGDGTFRAFGSIAFNTPEGVQTGDVDGDGRADLLVTDTANSTLSVCLGNGDGTFKAPVPYPLSGTPSALAVKDFNGDGRADVAVGHQVGNVLDVFLAQPGGALQAAPAVPTGGIPFGVNWASLRGGPSLLVANNLSSTASVIPINSDGTFRDATPNVQLGTANGAASGDINGDGISDLAEFAGSKTVKILLGKRDGTFQSMPDVSALGARVNQVALVDLNGDGRLDLLLDSDTTFQVCLGNGDGTFSTPLATGGANKSFAVGDWSGDGIPDVVLADGDGNRLLLLRGLGDGTFAPAVAITVNNTPALVAIGDVNGDQKLDLLVGTSAGVSLLLGNGNGTFGAAVSVSNHPPSALAMGDMNGDNLADGVTIDVFGTTLYLLKSNGNGTFTESTIGTPLAGGNLTLTDVNGDGNLDCLYAGNTGAGIAVGNGDGTFQPLIVFGTPAVGSICVGDFNGDFKPDLVVNAGTSFLLLHL